MHVGSLAIFASTGASPETILQKFRDHTVARFDLLPSYRRHLQPAPLNLDQPFWVREENIDLGYHIQRRTLPQPGTMVTVCAPWSPTCTPGAARSRSAALAISPDRRFGERRVRRLHEDTPRVRWMAWRAPWPCR